MTNVFFVYFRMTFSTAVTLPQVNPFVLPSVLRPSSPRAL